MSSSYLGRFLLHFLRPDQNWGAFPARKNEKFSYMKAWVIEKLELDSVLQQPVRTLSLGQRMKAEIAATLIHCPTILYLDEPTIGLDVLVKHKIRDVLSDYQKMSGATLIVTSHDLGDIKELCTRLLVLDKGNLLYDGPINQFEQKYGGKVNVSIVCDKLHWNRKKATVIVTIYILVVGALVSLGFGPLSFIKIIGLGLLDFFDFLSNSVLMPIVALLTCICIGFFVKPQVLCDEVEINNPFKEKKFYIIMLKYGAPICLILILLFAVSEAMGWIKV